MTRARTWLIRFLMFVSWEWAAAFASMYFGLQVALAQVLPHQAQANSAFATILPGGGSAWIATLLFVSAPLLVGSGAHIYGLLCDKEGWIMGGTLSEWFVYLAALISCLRGNPWGTGHPAYVGYSALWALLYLDRHFGVRWTPSFDVKDHDAPCTSRPS